jgi:hypothetical protein
MSHDLRLRRATDGVEHLVACLLAVAASLLLVVASSTGTAVYRARLETASTQARAVLLEDAETVAAGEPGTGLSVRVQARWTDRTGAERTGEIKVAQTARTGDEVPVWLRPDGTAAGTVPGSHPILAGIVTAAALVLGGGTLLAAGWLWVRSRTASRDARRWEPGWARVGPGWRR